MNKNSNILILFVRAPRLRQVKTRLQASLGAAPTLKLYRAMVADLLAGVSHGRFDIRICYTPGDAGAEMQEWLGEGYKYVPQQGEDLGQRMDNAFASAFKSGYRKAVIIGSDLPGIDTLAISIALTKLDAHDLVLGPSSDGGYYLVGLKQRQKRMFHNIKWSTDTVLRDTIHLANKLKLSIYQMEQRTDVDTFENLMELWKELQQEMERRDEVCCPQTYAALQKIFSKLPELMIS